MFPSGNNPFNPGDDYTELSDEEWQAHVASHSTSRYAFRMAFDGLYYAITSLTILLIWGVSAGSMVAGTIIIILGIRSLLVAWLLMLIVGALYNQHVLVSEPIGFLPCIPIAFLLVVFFALVMPSRNR